MKTQEMIALVTKGAAKQAANSVVDERVAVDAQIPAGPVGRDNWKDEVPVENRNIASKGLLFVFGLVGW